MKKDETVPPLLTAVVFVGIIVWAIYVSRSCSQDLEEFKQRLAQELPSLPLLWLLLAGTVGEEAAQYFQGRLERDSFSKWAEILLDRFLNHSAPHLVSGDELRKFFISDGDQVVRFVVTQRDIVSGLVALDELGFQDERVNLRFRSFEFD